MRILLAPMEGVVDPILRELLTEIGGINYCATEFVRVTRSVLPASVYFRYCPELLQGGTTRSGVPVFVQLLGGDPQLMAENAFLVEKLGAPGVDLNFGCPAKTVNRRDGGAALLKKPHRVHDVVLAVRKAVCKTIPVTAKIRLGYDSPDRAVEIAQGAEAAGAHWLTVHARTKEDGYRPPAHWEWLAKIREAIKIPLIANGDIWSLEDYNRCREVSGCRDVMLGRGIIARPDLAAQIGLNTKPLRWEQIEAMLPRFFKASERAKSTHHAICRLKQWLRLLGRNYLSAAHLFESIKRDNSDKSIKIAFAKAGQMRYVCPSSDLEKGVAHV